MKTIVLCLRLACLSLVCLTICQPTMADENCGAVPAQPKLLNNHRLDLDELELLAEQIKIYFSHIETYKNCLDDAVMALDVEAASYQTQFEEQVRLFDAVNDQKHIVIDRFNVLIETAAPKEALSVADNQIGVDPNAVDEPSPETVPEGALE